MELFARYTDGTKEPLSLSDLDIKYDFSAEGESYVTVTYVKEGYGGTFSVNVKKPSVKFSSSVLAGEIGKPLTLRAASDPEGLEVTFFTEDKEKAEISGNLITPLSEGKIKIFASITYNGVTYTDVRTQPIPADGHKLSAVAEVPAACTENGVKAHWVCSVCGKLFSDAEGKNETTLEALTIPALGHKTELVGAKAATCTEDGYTGDEVCTVCGETVKKGEVIPALGHKTQLVGAKAATCTEDGYTGDQVCTVCGETVKKGEVIPALGHKTQLVGAKAATCTEDGYTGDEVCTVCQEIVKKGEVIPALGHKTQLVGAKAATCTQDGYTGDEVCTVCNETVKKGETIPAAGHDYKDGKCTVCGETDPNYKPDEPVQPENPGVKTGDEAHTALWLAAASVSLLAAAALLLGKKKHLS